MTTSDQHGEAAVGGAGTGPAADDPVVVSDPRSRERRAPWHVDDPFEQLQWVVRIIATGGLMVPVTAFVLLLVFRMLPDVGAAEPAGVARGWMQGSGFYTVAWLVALVTAIATAIACPLLWVLAVLVFPRTLPGVPSAGARWIARGAAVVLTVLVIVWATLGSLH